jgi:hypothetical protein
VVRAGLVLANQETQCEFGQNLVMDLDVETRTVTFQTFFSCSTSQRILLSVDWRRTSILFGAGHVPLHAQ